MTSIMELGIQHFASLPQHEIAIPEIEIGGQPLVLYFATPNSVTLSKCLLAAKGNHVEYGARLVAACTRTEGGEKAFPGPADHAVLMRQWHPAIVARIANAIAEKARLDFSEAGIVDAEKN